METELPPEFATERDALIKEIYAAFEGATRDGGVSWSEAEVIDAYGSEEACNEARARDREPGWQTLVKDEEWHPGSGVGGWCFLDAIGFRYYLPAALVRCLNKGMDEGIVYWLNLSNVSDREWLLQKWSALDERQRGGIRRFLLHMSAVAFENNWDVDFDNWQDALESYWSSLPPSTESR